MVWLRVKVYFFHYEYLIVPEPSMEETIFLHCYAEPLLFNFQHLHGSPWASSAILFVYSSALFHWYVCILTIWSNHSGSIISLKTSKASSPAFFAKTALAILGPLNCHKNFRINSSSFTARISWDFHGLGLAPKLNWGKINILKIINLQCLSIAFLLI